MIQSKAYDMAALAESEGAFGDHNDFFTMMMAAVSCFKFPRAVLLKVCAELGPTLERDGEKLNISCSLTSADDTGFPE